MGVKSMVTKESKIDEGKMLVQIEWEGQSITSADELYHTVWETYEGMTCIQSPVSGVVEDAVGMPCGIDEETILLKMTITDDAWESIKKKVLVKESEYLKKIESMPSG